MSFGKRRGKALAWLAAFFLFGPGFYGFAGSKKANERVWVTRPDGSLQCDPKVVGAKGTAAKNEPLREARAELEAKGVKVHEARARNDGKMRAQACGFATGNETAIQIDRRDLGKAKEMGFEPFSD